MKKYLLIFCIIFIFSLPVFAANNIENDFGVFCALGEMYGLGTIRIGYKGWEAGYIHRGMYTSLGIIKNVHFGNLYMGLGVGFWNYDHSAIRSYGAVIGTIGGDYPLLSWLSLRGEFIAIGQTQGIGYGGVLLGLRMHF